MNLPSAILGVIILRSPPIIIFSLTLIQVAVAISISVSPEDGIKT